MAAPSGEHHAVDAEPDRPRGAWGIRIAAPEPAQGLLSPAPPDWPLVQVHAAVCDELSREVEWGPRRAQYTLLGGHHIRIERDPLTVDLQLCRPTSEEAVIVPHLSSVGSTVALWNGNEAFHAGAFIHEAGAWGVLGEKGAGKTSTLAALDRLGLPVMTDDLLIYQQGNVLAGPRCLDLRRGPAAAMSQGEDIGVVGTRRRWRVYLGPCPLSAPLRGWLVPSWDDTNRIERIEPTERLRMLPRFRALQVPWEDPASLLELAAYPAYRWLRPRQLDDLEANTARLLELLDRAV
jgi:hypothetical protein